MPAVIVIPARYGSSRFPAKPLHKIAGVTMLERVWRIAKAVAGAARVVIATEDQRIIAHAASFGAEAVLTPDDCLTGSDRVHAAIGAAQISEDIILNLQGDAPLTPPWVLEAMIADMQSSQDADIVTPAILLQGEALEQFRVHKDIAPASGTTVVFDHNRNALYFSKNILPFMRKAGAAPVYRHIGLYGYRRAALEKFIGLAPSLLSQAEGLEQLRALENGMKIRVPIVDYRGRTHGSVDAPEDVALIEAIIAREGELV